MILDLLAGLGPIKLGLTLAALVGLALIGAKAALAFLKSLVVGLAFRHVIYGGVSALAGSLLTRYVDGGLLGLLDLVLGFLLGLVGLG